MRFPTGHAPPARPSPPPAFDWQQGEDFGEYRLLSEIARGGMGCVYRAHHRRLNRIVALKKMLPGLIKDREGIRRFHIEAEAAAALSHPNIVPVYEIGELNGEHFFTMAFVDGEDLRRQLNHRTFSPEEAATYVQKVAWAIHHAHQRGVLHRDLKPSNIIVDQANQPQVADFGIAKLRDTTEDGTQAGILGTPHYMAPEQAQPGSDQISVATDVYGLGAVLYHLLTQHPPFADDNIEKILWSVYYDDPVPPTTYNPKIPKHLEFICLKCLKKSPQERYTSAQALAEDLQRFLHHKPLAALPASPQRRFTMWVRRNPVPALLLLLLSIAIATGGLIQRHSLQRLRTARAASETIIGFMNADLSRDLREVGRLDLMEKINAHAEAYYTHHTAVGDPGFWERKAMFYENTASVEKDLGNLDRAEQAAQQAQALYQHVYHHTQAPSWTAAFTPHPNHAHAHALIRAAHVQILRANIARESGQLLAASHHAQSAVKLARDTLQIKTLNPTNRALYALALTEQANLWLDRDRLSLTHPALQNITTAENTLREILDPHFVVPALPQPPTSDLRPPTSAAADPNPRSLSALQPAPRSLSSPAGGGTVPGSLSALQPVPVPPRSLSGLQPVPVPVPAPPDWALWLANCHYYRGRAHQVRKDNPAALTHFNQYLAAIAHLLQTHSHNTRWHYELAVAHGRVGQTLYLMQQYHPAQSYWKTCEQHAAWLLANDPRNAVWQSLYSRSLGWQAQSAWQQNSRAPSTHERLRTALTIQSNLVLRNPSWDRLREDLAGANSLLAKWHEQAGEHPQALAILADWRAQSRTFALRNPEQFGDQSRWADAMVEQAEFKGRREGPDQTIAILQDALAEVQATPDTPYRAAAEARIRGRLANAFRITDNTLVAAVELHEALRLRLALFGKVPHSKTLRDRIVNNFRYAVQYFSDAGQTEQALSLAQYALDWTNSRFFPEEYRSDFGQIALTALKIGTSDPEQSALARTIAQRCIRERFATPPTLSEREERLKQQLLEGLDQLP